MSAPRCPACDGPVEHYQAHEAGVYEAIVWSIARQVYRSRPLRYEARSAPLAACSRCEWVAPLP